jgi:hypothetical protein
MLQQVVGSVFSLMQEYAPVWLQHRGNTPSPVFGFRFDVGLEPVQVNVERMLQAFLCGYEELGEVWSLALAPENFTAVRMLGLSLREKPSAFHINDELWAKVILDFACACNEHPLTKATILRSMTPLYLARVASFVHETEMLGACDVEERIERLCLTFENLKPYLIERWPEIHSRQVKQEVLAHD